jgi:hypothetical protein
MKCAPAAFGPRDGGDQAIDMGGAIVRFGKG